MKRNIVFVDNNIHVEVKFTQLSDFTYIDKDFNQTYNAMISSQNVNSRKSSTKMEIKVIFQDFFSPRSKSKSFSRIRRVPCHLTLPYRCSLSDTTLDTMVLHSSLLVAISAHLFMFIPAYRETFPSHPHLFLPRPRLPFTMPSVIIRCRLSCLLTCP